jgi:hypothetical protein
VFGTGRRRKPAGPAGPAEPAKNGRSSAGYERERERLAGLKADRSRSGRDVGPLPPVANPERKARCGASFEAFCRAYFPQTFSLAWSADHRRAIERIEQAVRSGGLFAYAMPRGSGKTSLAVAAYLWALLYGLQDFVAVIGADAGAAGSLLESGKSELECNEALAEDFPEACYPIRRLEGIAQRGNGQLLDGRRTHIGWTANEIVLPTVAGSACSAGIVRVAGITGRIRGMQFTRPDGKKVRPGLVIVDDPQTDDSAKSPTQVADREKTVKGAVLGLAGPGKQIAGIMPCTVISPDDLADRVLDRSKHPEWQGERTKLLYGWPPTAEALKTDEAVKRREDLWDRYAKVRADSLRNGNGGREANEFYQANREGMDHGLTAAWPVRHHPNELSAVQHAFNLMLDLGRTAFMAEYQNEPVAPDATSEDALTGEQIAAKADGSPRSVVPPGATRLVAFIDIQKELLFYGVLALEDDFTGHVIDYGTHPDQHREHFAKSNVRRTLMQAEKAQRFEESLLKGLDTAGQRILGRGWKREDGGTARVERCLVDARWGESTDIVRTFCRTSTHAGILTPSFGRGVGASSLPITEQGRKRGDRAGLNWLMPVPKPGLTRHVVYDTNAWKSFLMARLGQAPGGGGCFTIFGRPEDHQLLSEHLTAEYSVETEGRGRKVQEWKVKPHRPDNDWLDCLTGCCVAGSIAGATLKELPASGPGSRPRVSLAELQRNARHHAPR